ncbi:MAG: hypothetical protein M1840_009149 [Geoglossum simile]|nr:MAG: hypothetical protein M1840_009149 [Geoglossum simile]
MPQGHCTVTQIRHWASRLGPQWHKHAIARWRDDCPRTSPNPGSHGIRNRNLYMHCVLAIYTEYSSTAIAKRLSHVLGLELCPDVVEYAQRKMKWNGMLKRIQEKGPKHPWVMQTMDRLSFKEPRTMNSLRSASKTREGDYAYIRDRGGNRSAGANSTRARSPLQSRHQRRFHARSRAAHSPSFTTRRWARKPLYVWIWLFQQRSRIRCHPITGEWQWENPLRRDIWWYKSAYEKAPSPTSSEEPMPVRTSSSEGVGFNSLSSSFIRSGDEGMLPPSRTEMNMDVISDLQLPEPLRAITPPGAAVEGFALGDREIGVVGPEAAGGGSLSEAVVEGFVPMDMESERPGPEGLAMTDGLEVEGEEGDTEVEDVEGDIEVEDVEGDTEVEDVEDDMEVDDVEGDTEVEGEDGGERSSSGTGLDVAELMAGGVQGLHGAWLGDSPGR